MRAGIWAFCGLLAAAPACAGERNLLYFSAAPDYLGAGWMRAPRGLDLSGPVFGAEVGTSFEGSFRAMLAGGWRQVHGRLVATLVAGAEADTEGVQARPLVAADLWWDDRGFMAAGFAKLTEDYADWRLAAGYRVSTRWPWIGPEVSARDGPPRIGLQATGISLPFSAQARLSAGAGEDEAFAEIALWRRF